MKDLNDLDFAVSNEKGVAIYASSYQTVMHPNVSLTYTNELFVVPWMMKLIQSYLSYIDLDQVQYAKWVALHTCCSENESSPPYIFSCFLHPTSPHNQKLLL